MPRWPAILAILALAPAAPGRAQVVTQMGPERVREALDWGQTAADGELEQYELWTDRTWLVNFDTPFLRVAQHSRAARSQEQGVAEGDVSPKLAAPELHVYAHARAQAARGPLPNIDYVMIIRPRSGGPSDTILPTVIQSFVRRVPMDSDFTGPTRIARSVKAVFPLSALAPGNAVRLTFEGGAVHTVTIAPEALARVR